MSAGQAAALPAQSISGRRSERLVSSAAIALPALVSAAFAVYALSRPNQLFGVSAYDDGVYYGAADRLVHGIVPYRDFAFVHPPGIALVLAPVAAIGRALGSRDGMAIARLVTGAFAVANVVLVGVVVRHRGAIASLGAGLWLACFPLAITADNTVFLEPFVVFFCLLALVACFSSGSLASPRRCVLGGAAIGLACAVKIDAAIVLFVLLIVTSRRKRAALSVAIGATGAIVASCIAFFALAPGAFFHDVVVSQLERGSTKAASPSVARRLVDLTGLGGLSAFRPTALEGAVVAAVIVVGLLAWVVVSRLALDDLSRATVAALVLVCAAELFTPAFYLYYSYLPAALLAVGVGLVAGEGGRLFAARPASKKRAPLFALGVVLVGLIAFAAQQSAQFTRAFVAANGASDIAGIVDTVIPAGACVVFDEADLAITSNRFDSAGPCPATVDSFGAWLAADPHDPPPGSAPLAALAASWQGWLGSADYFIEVEPYSDFIPWTAGLTSYLGHHYRLVSASRRAYIYENLSPPAR